MRPLNVAAAVFCFGSFIVCFTGGLKEDSPGYMLFGVLMLVSSALNAYLAVMP